MQEVGKRGSMGYDRAQGLKSRTAGVGVGVDG